MQTPDVRSYRAVSNTLDSDVMRRAATLCGLQILYTSGKVIDFAIDYL